MAQGIRLAGGFGAEGAGLGLEKVIEQRLVREKFDELKRQAAAEELFRQQQLAQQAALTRERMGQEGQQFGETMRLNRDKFGENTRQFDVRTGEERRQFDTGLEFKRGESQREQGNTERGFGLKERQLTEEERSNRAGEGIARTRVGAAGSNRTVKISYADPETGQVFEEYVTPEEARKRGPIRKGMSAKDVEAGNAMSDYVKKIDQAIALGDKSNWAGTGFFVGRAAGALGGKFASEEGLKLRGLIGDLFAENANERFGGALTPQEIERAKSYLAEATDDPKKIKVNLQRMREVVAPALERWKTRRGGGAPAGGGDDHNDPLGIR